MIRRYLAKLSRTRSPVFPISDFFTHAATTPLTQITLNIETIIERLQNRADMIEEVHLLYQTLLQTQHLNSLLSVIKQPTQKPYSRFPAKAALEEVVIRCHQPHIGKHLQATLMLDKEAWLPGHAFYFQEIVSCVITNAFEAYGKYQRQKSIALVAMQQNKKLQLYICDQGKGMNWVTTQLATQKGFTQKASGQGIGLSFVKHIVETYFKGRFIITSYANVGTVVMIQVPLKG